MVRFMCGYTQVLLATVFGGKLFVDGSLMCKRGSQGDKPDG